MHQSETDKDASLKVIVLLIRFCKGFKFDKVLYRMLDKLDYLGISGSTHKWISLWLSESIQQVVLDGHASDPVPVLSRPGIPVFHRCQS